MDRKAPLSKLPDRTPTWAKAAALARGWGLEALAGGLMFLRAVAMRRVVRLGDDYLAHPLEVLVRSAKDPAETFAGAVRAFRHALSVSTFCYPGSTSYISYHYRTDKDHFDGAFEARAPI